MGQLIKYVFLGVILVAILVAVNLSFFSENLFADTPVNHIMAILYIVAAVAPCIVYYIKMPPGTNTKP